MYLVNNMFAFENHILHIAILSAVGIFLIIILSELFKLYPYMELKNIYLDYIFYKIEKNNLNITDNVINIISFVEKYNRLFE